MDKKIAEQKAWQKIIGNKIVCSGCNQKQHETVFIDNSPEVDCFEYTLTKRGRKSFVGVRCISCGHTGDYNPTDEEVYQYEFIARANIDLQILGEHGDDPPITNVEVDSVFRREGWKNDVPEATLDNWKAKCEKNYVIEV